MIKTFNANSILFYVKYMMLISTLYQLNYLSQDRGTFYEYLVYIL